jgi:hypothetical protein
MSAPCRVSPVTSSSSSSRLVRGNHAGDSKAAEAIRDLVETVTVFRQPSRPGGVTVEIAGCLNALRGERAYPNEVHKRFGLAPDRLAADTAYGAAPILNWLVDAKSIAPHIPVNDKSKREDGTFSRGDFRYDPTNDVYHCPPGEGPDAMRVSSKSKNGSVA